jgi:hypothetical protein
MRMERLLLLWDDLDDWMGMAFHGILHVVHSVLGTCRDVTQAVDDWLGAIEVRSGVAVSEAAPKA